MGEYTEVSEIWIWTVWDPDDNPAEAPDRAAADAAPTTAGATTPASATTSAPEAEPTPGATTVTTPESAPGTAPAVAGYAVEASDGHIGTVDAVSYDAGTGAVVVDTGHWIFGKKRMVPAGMISAIDHEKRVVRLSCSKADVKAAPDHDATRVDDAAHRGEVAEHYDKTGAETGVDA